MWSDPANHVEVVVGSCEWSAGIWKGRKCMHQHWRTPRPRDVWRRERAASAAHISGRANARGQHEGERRMIRAALVAPLICALAACRHRVSLPSPSTSALSPAGPALTITGDPESADGATWTLIGTLDGTTRRSPGHPPEAARRHPDGTIPSRRAQSWRRRKRPVVWAGARCGDAQVGAGLHRDQLHPCARRAHRNAWER